MPSARSRKVFADEVILKNIYKNEIGQQEVSYGLIVGQYAHNQDLVTHLARTPNRGFENPRHLTLIKEKFVQRHVLELTRMLPGGFWVLGIFIQTTEDIFATAAYDCKYLDIFRAMDACLSKEPHLNGIPPTRGRLICHVDLTGHEFTCKSINLDDGSYTNIIWSFEKISKLWLIGTYMWNNIPGYKVSTKKGRITKEAELREQLNVFRKNIETCQYMVTGKKADGDDRLVDYTIMETDKETGKKERIFHINLYMPNDCGAPDAPDEPPDIPDEMSCYAILTCKVYLNVEATVEETVEAVKCDLYRSWTARLHRHLELLSGSSPRYLEHPRKVFVRTEAHHIHFLYYFFPGEVTSNEEIQREIEAILGATDDQRVIAYDPYAPAGTEVAGREDFDNVKAIFFILSVVMMFLALAFYSLYPNETAETIPEKSVATSQNIIS